MGEDRERGVVGLLRQAQQRVPKLTSDGELCPGMIKLLQPKEDRDQLGRLAHLLTQRACLRVDVLRLGRRIPFRDLQRRTEGNVQGQGVLETLRRLWQGREELDRGGEMADGFQMGRARAGVLTRSLPVGNGLLGEARLSVVMRHQLWLCLYSLGKLFFQDLGNALMVLLARAPQE